MKWLWNKYKTGLEFLTWLLFYSVIDSALNKPLSRKTEGLIISAVPLAIMVRFLAMPIYAVYFFKVVKGKINKVHSSASVNSDIQ